MRSDSSMRLVRRSESVSAGHRWDDEVAALFTVAQVEPGWLPWQVLGGPGTGKTTLLIDLAAARIADGAAPETVLVLTHAKPAALRVRAAITGRLAGGGVPGANREPMVRTVHSYAFAILRAHAAAAGNPPPRLLTGAEQDVVLREMLRGDLEDIRAGAEELWPPRLRPALETAGFAEQLRDLMLRATERGLGPEDLIDLGCRYDRDEWIAAGRFAERYEQAMLLRWSVGVTAPEASAPALDAAELVGAALEVLALDPDLLAAERTRLGCLLVDDAQHLDPLAADLIRVVGSGPATTVIAGDPDQSVFSYRGADPAFAADTNARPDRRLILSTDHRSSSEVHRAVARISSRLPGFAPHRFGVGRTAVGRGVESSAGLGDFAAKIPELESLSARPEPGSDSDTTDAGRFSSEPEPFPPEGFGVDREQDESEHLGPDSAAGEPDSPGIEPDSRGVDMGSGSMVVGDDSDELEANPGEFRVRVLTTQAKEAALIADHLRRAHLADGVPWGRMAVIVRSVPLSLAPLRRALLAAGVPVRQPKPSVPLARRNGSAWMLAALRALLAGERDRPGLFTPDDALDLLAGPLGGADQISLRRLRRGVRRTVLERGGARFEDAPEDEYIPTAAADGEIAPADAVPAAADGVVAGVETISAAGGAETPGSSRIDSPESDSPVAEMDRPSAQVLRDLMVGTGDLSLLDRLTDVEAAPLRRVLAALRRARKVRARGAGLEEVLWGLWTASRLEQRWTRQAERGGAGGIQADRDLDAAVGLFDAAAAYVDRLPRATAEGFVEYLEQQVIPQDSAPLTDSGDAVAIVSAHAAVGQEWDVVAVAGVQEGIWPNLRPRGTLLGIEDLVDLRAGVSDPGEQLSRSAPILAEERRLLLVACSRARRSLLVTAVESVTGDRDLVPSRFLAELDPQAGPGETGKVPVPEDPGRALVMQALIAELRGVACDVEDTPDRRRRAATQLARLAAAGVRGAHPDEWYGTAEPSSQLPLWGADQGPIALSPSTVELLRTCPLRWALERHGGSDGDNPHAVKGNLVHTLVQALAGQVTLDQVKLALARAWRAVDPASTENGPRSWHSRKDLERTSDMLDVFVAWLANTRHELTLLGVEVPVDCVLPARDADEYPVRLRGRVDRVERDALGRFVIVDVKTAKTPISKPAAEDHAQLATYQVAAGAGGLTDLEGDAPGGARLVYVAKPNIKDGATQRMQPALDEESEREWRGTIHDAAPATRGPSYLAMRNDGCRHCSVSGCCPVQDSGRQVTDE